ncbi:MAG TPA: Ig-like domain-containing protein [Candidatus Paceibacterota bacterium]|nr:Ig-like domain-containing protein [Candidatus Paceibacterota bacterium]
MNRTAFFRSVLVLPLLSVFFLLTPAFASANTINVPADYSAIQAAIDHSNSGDTINVAAGTYDAFSVVGKTNLTITGAGVGSTIIKPTALINTGVGHKYTANMQVSVFVNNSTGITLGGMSVEDNGQAPGAGGPDALVFWNASSGTIQNSNVQGAYTINGDQTGQGIAVDAGFGQTTNLTVNNVAISGFQQNGIDAVDGNSLTSNRGAITLTVTGGSITGAGSTNVIAQNGILFWNQGGGSVTGSVNGTSISNLKYSPTPEATGILAYGAASISSISNVSFSGIDLYINSASSGTPINATTGNIFDGVSPANVMGSQLATIENKLSGVMEAAGTDPIYILPNTLIVTTTAPNRGIQAGLNTVVSSGTVLVTPGTYSGDLLPTATANVTLAGIGTPVINLGSGYGINLDNPPAVVTGFTMSGFTINAQPSTTYAFKAYKANGLTLANDTFNGGAGNTGGGVDINTTSNVTLNNVISSGFYKNGFADTSAYTSADSSASGNNITFNNITATHNGWNGIAFYTAGGSEGLASINGVKFTGTDTVSGNGTTGATQGGIFIEGDSDTNLGLGHTPSYTIISDGSTLDLSHVAFGGNAPSDIFNYQTAPVNAIGATFDPGAITGNTMTPPQRTTEDGKIVDKLDNSVLGLVTYYTVDTNSIVFVESPQYVRVNNPGDMDAQIVTPSNTTAVRFYIDGSATPIAGTYAAPATPTTAWWRLFTSLSDPAGEHTITAQVEIGGNWYNVTGSGIVYALDNPVVSFVFPNPSYDVFRPSDDPARVTVDDTNDSFSDVVFSISGMSTTWTVQRAQCDLREAGNRVLCDISDASNWAGNLPDGTYTATAIAYNQARGNTEITSQSFTVDSSVPVVTNFSINPTATTYKTTIDVSADATDAESGIQNVEFFITAPRASDGMCDGNGAILVDSKVTTPTSGSTYGTTLNTSALTGTYCVNVVAENLASGHSLPQEIQVNIDNTVTPNAPEVITNAASSVTASDATLNGTNGDNIAAQESFWVSTSPIVTTSSNIPAGVYSTPVFTDPSDLAANGMFSASLSSLMTDAITTGGATGVNLPSITPGTTYYYVAWSLVGGTWYPGAQQSFTTAPAAPVAVSPLTGVTLTTATWTEADWTDVTTQLPGGITYIYQSATDPSTNTDGLFTNPAYTSGPLTASQIPTPGTPPATYYWHVRAVDSAGNSSAWSVVQTVVVNNTPVPSVTTNGADDLSTTGATVHGTNGPVIADNTSFWWGTTNPAGPFVATADPAGVSNPATDELPSGWNDGVFPGGETAGASFSYALTGLTPNTQYYFVAWAQVGGIWYPGSVSSFTTSATTPAAPVISGESLKVNSPTSVTITWTTDHNSTSRVVYGTTPQADNKTSICSSPDSTSYSCYGYSNSTDETNTPADTLGVTSHSVTISNLTSGITYYFRPVSEGSPEGVGNELSTAPIATAQAVSVAENGTLDITLSGTGPSGDTLTFATTSSPTNGMLSGTDANLTYTPSLNYVGGDSFAFTITDTATGVTSNPAVVTVNVSEGSPVLPVANGDGATTNNNTMVSIPVLNNDSNATGIDAASLTQPSHGTAVIDGTSIDYTPASGYAGTDSFTYEATGSGGTSATAATVTVTIKDTTVPVLTINGEKTDYITTGAKYSDQGATVTDTPTNNLGIKVTLDGNATTSDFTLDTSTDGTHTVVYSATDGGGNTGTATRTIIVDGTAPSAILTSTSTNPTTDNPIQMTVTFSEPVVGFDQSDLLVTGAALSNFAASSTNPLVYAFDLMPTGSDVEVVIAPNKYQDLAGNENTTPATFGITYSPLLPPSTPAPQVTQSLSVGGGGGVVGSSPLSFGYQTGGVVLGTSTEVTSTDTTLPAGCSALLTQYMGFGKKNDSSQVKLLQVFLNGNLNTNLPVTGFFGSMTTAAVKQFQTKYASVILTPWGLKDPTGYVYKFTEYEINLLSCSTLNAPVPTAN